MLEHSKAASVIAASAFLEEMDDLWRDRVSSEPEPIPPLRRLPALPASAGLRANATERPATLSVFECIFNYLTHL